MRHFAILEARGLLLLHQSGGARFAGVADAECLHSHLTACARSEQNAVCHRLAGILPKQFRLFHDSLLLGRHLISVLLAMEPGRDGAGSLYKSSLQFVILAVENAGG